MLFLLEKNDDERLQCSFGENSVQFVLYLYGILDEDCFINKDEVIEYYNPIVSIVFTKILLKNLIIIVKPI